MIANCNVWNNINVIFVINLFYKSEIRITKVNDCFSNKYKLISISYGLFFVTSKTHVSE